MTQFCETALEVVSEYGVAYLRGRSLVERARNLIGIAHPDFREQLMQDAWEQLGLRL